MVQLDEEARSQYKKADFEELVAKLAKFNLAKWLLIKK